MSPHAYMDGLGSPTGGGGVGGCIFEMSADLLGSFNDEGYFTALNPAWETTLGFSRDALTAQPYIEFVHPADRMRTLREAERMLSDGTVTTGFENRYALADGGWCWLSWQTERHGPNVFFVAHNVTARIVEERRRQLLTHMVEGLDDAIITKTTDGVVTSWNPVAEELFGFTEDEAVGKAMVDLIVPAELADEPKLIVDRLLRGEGVRQYTTQRHRKDGTLLTVSLTASLMRGDEHNVLGVAVVSRDITELSLEDIHARGEIDILVWVGRIRDAIDEGRVTFYAQPIVNFRGAPDSYELLCRIVDRDGGIVSPALFLPAAENYGLIEELDLLALREAARLIAEGHRVSINLSTATIGRRHIVDVIAAELSRAGADPADLTIEITETALMKNMTAAQRFVDALTALGCRLSLDDFGTGFGGFTYLKKLSIDQLKIDIEFVRDLTSSAGSKHVVKAVVSLAKSFGLDTVAEGVEDAETAALLEQYGVAHCQGYFFGRPEPMADVLRNRIRQTSRFEGHE